MPQELKWRYYNHAIIPTTAPHIKVDETVLHNKNIWKMFGGYPLFARWTSDFDCKEDTGWWFEIRDTPFDLMEVSTRYRTKIRKGLKNFEVRIIDPAQYERELYQVLMDAVASYSAKCRIKIAFDEFKSDLKNWQGGKTFAAFCNEDNVIAGYMFVRHNEGHKALSVLKAMPSYENKQVNAALIYNVLEAYRDELSNGEYILTGERSIMHETNSHEYFEKYFGFRKAYCRLHLLYRRGVKQMVVLLYPFRNLFERWKRIKLFCLIGSVLKMEEITRHGGSPSQAKEVEPHADMAD